MSLSALLAAAAGGSPAVVERLLAAGAPLDARDAPARRTALHAAAAAGNTTVVRLLLARGADCTVRDANGRTPLVAALEAPAFSEATCEALARADHFSRGAPTDLGALLPTLAARLSGLPKLDAPVSAAACFLLARGEPVDCRDGGGRTALMHAARWGDAALVATLLARGADPTAVDAHGDSVLRHALRSGSPRTVAALLLRGAPGLVPTPADLAPLATAPGAVSALLAPAPPPPPPVNHLLVQQPLTREERRAARARARQGGASAPLIVRPRHGVGATSDGGNADGVGDLGGGDLRSWQRSAASAAGDAGSRYGERVDTCCPGAWRVNWGSGGDAARAVRGVDGGCGDTCSGDGGLASCCAAGGAGACAVGGDDGSGSDSEGESEGDLDDSSGPRGQQLPPATTAAVQPPSAGAPAPAVALALPPLSRDALPESLPLELMPLFAQQCVAWRRGA